MERNTHVSRVDLNFAPGMPLIQGFAGDFSQSILNMVVNAAHAIEEASKANAGNPMTILITDAKQA